jgi:4-hydroxyphenylacetate 3-monooxygenase
MSQIKTGADHLRALRDGRAVFLDGKPVADVTTHPAFRNAVATTAALYDFQAENPELMTFDIGGGRRANLAWQMPRGYDELVARRRALSAWAGVHHGFMGRSPDHVASCITGQAMGIDLFRRHGPARADALLRYYEEARREDRYLTYVIINPQVDRAKSWGEHEPDLVARIVDEDSAGLTITGAKMLGTGAIMANEVLVANLQPLKQGEEALAFSCALPIATPGLRVLSRKSYEAHAVSRFDNPLAWGFDENDAILHFQDVRVPWERVFVHRDTDMCRAQFHDTPAHVYQNYQAQIRLAVKLKFLVGVARRIAETIGTIGMAPVRETLGRLAARAAMVDAMVHGMEAAGAREGDYFVPHRHFMYSAQVLAQELYPEVIETIRGLAGGSLIMLPGSVADYHDPETARIIGLTQRSPAMPSDDRVKFLKAAWDAVGSEFASRHLQYEMFYAGAPFVTAAHSFRTFDWAGATGAVDALLAGYDRPGAGTARAVALAAE